MVMPVTGVPPATVVRLLTVMLRSVVPVAEIVKVLKSTPSGCSVPVKVSVLATGAGAVGLPPHPAMTKRAVAQSAIGSVRLCVRVGIARPSLRGAGTPGGRISLSHPFGLQQVIRGRAPILAASMGDLTSCRIFHVRRRHPSLPRATVADRAVR